MKGISILFVLAGCAAGPRDTLGGGGPVVRSDAGAPPAYAYVARKPLVAVGLAQVQGISDEDSHALVDRLADSASRCLRTKTNLVPGIARITVPIDPGGIAGPPDAVFSPRETATAVGMICILAPLRMTTLGPASADAGARSITIESAWGAQ